MSSSRFIESYMKGIPSNVSILIEKKIDRSLNSINVKLPNEELYISEKTKKEIENIMSNRHLDYDEKLKLITSIVTKSLYGKNNESDVVNKTLNNRDFNNFFMNMHNIHIKDNNFEKTIEKNKKGDWYSFFNSIPGTSIVKPVIGAVTLFVIGSVVFNSIPRNKDENFNTNLLNLMDKNIQKGIHGASGISEMLFNTYNSGINMINDIKDTFGKQRENNISSNTSSDSSIPKTTTLPNESSINDNKITTIKDLMNSTRKLPKGFDPGETYAIYPGWNTHIRKKINSYSLNNKKK